VRILTESKDHAAVVRERETIDSELRFVEQVGPRTLHGNRVPVYWFVALRKTAPRHVDERLNEQLAHRSRAGRVRPVGKDE
jgi:hypothetical protein